MLACISLGGAVAFNAPAMHVMTSTSRAAIRLSERWDDKILNPDVPDPVWDEVEKSPYTGRVPYGFSATAEKWNGRAAMMGFTILYIQEAIA